MKIFLTNQQRFIFGGCYVFIVCLALLDFKYHFSVLRYPFEFVMYPLQSLQVKGRDVVDFPNHLFRSAASSEKMLLDLQQEVTALKVENAEARVLKKENVELKAELENKFGQKKETQKFALTAHIITIGPVSYIDTGSREGVQSNDLVMSQGVLLGKIKEPEHLFSSVSFFSKEAWEVVAKTESGVRGIIKGKNGVVYFSQVPSDKKIETGQVLYTAGNPTELIPSGLYIGEVSEVIQNPGEPFQTAVVKQSVDLSSLTTVQVSRW